ncbi:hypothetical protein AEQ67_06690 [Pseudomonas sp. RIT-PI-q]|nr:hypothetical protein AEQ67_06690 [Pseudomonas sp. RIT-PI-q]
MECRSWLASEDLKCATFILLKRAIVNALRWQASSYRGMRTPNQAGPQAAELLILMQRAHGAGPERGTERKG